jgi:hypothetical protein
VFGRPEAFGAVQRCPDIDVLVPPAALDAVREYARAARTGSFPVAIDASGAACFIDLRPRSEQSYLTHRRLRFPVPSDLFAPRPAWLEGVEMTTIDPRVPLHTFGTIGGNRPAQGRAEDHGAGGRAGIRRGGEQIQPGRLRCVRALGTEAVQPGEQSEMIGDVSRSAAQDLPAGEQHLGVLGVDFLEADHIGVTRFDSDANMLLCAPLLTCLLL